MDPPALRSGQPAAERHGSHGEPPLPGRPAARPRSPDSRSGTRPAPGPPRPSSALWSFPAASRNSRRSVYSSVMRLISQVLLTLLVARTPGGPGLAGRVALREPEVSGPGDHHVPHLRPAADPGVVGKLVQDPGRDRSWPRPHDRRAVRIALSRRGRSREPPSCSALLSAGEQPRSPRSRRMSRRASGRGGRPARAAAMARFERSCPRERGRPNRLRRGRAGWGRPLPQRGECEPLGARRGGCPGPVDLTSSRWRPLPDPGGGQSAVGCRPDHAVRRHGDACGDTAGEPAEGQEARPGP